MKIVALRSKKKAERGAALIGALLLLFMLTAMAVAVTYLVMSEIRVGGSDREMNSAYYGAEAGMEKMMSDLRGLYVQSQAPTAAQITALGANPPNLPGINYPGAIAYQFSFPLGMNADGITPKSTNRTISPGSPNAGLNAQIIPMQLQVIAQRPNSPQVKMQRSIEVALIPVFQFGVFSEADLSYFAGPNFDFAGRVHTNGNLFLADTGTLTLHGKVTAVGEVVRHQLANGVDTVATGRTGKIMIPTDTTTGCTTGQSTSNTHCRDLQETEGSVTLGLNPKTLNSNWSNISLSTNPSIGYNGMILNGSTGAKVLELPFVQGGTPPIAIIRRPSYYPSLTAPTGEDPASDVGISRLFNQAQIRVLISDDPSELSAAGAGDADNVRLENVSGATYPTSITVATATTSPDYRTSYFAMANKTKTTDGAQWVRPPGVALSSNTFSLLSQPVTGSYLRVEIRTSCGSGCYSYTPVTQEWLQLGFERGSGEPGASYANPVHPNAILILQKAADVISGANNAAMNWYPINLYDSREGEVRDTTSGKAAGSATANGVMNVVELDVGNLKKWLAGTGAYAGLSGTSVETTSQNGYILYFSDRRGMLKESTSDPTSPTTSTSVDKLGEYGWEDNVNPSDGAGAPNAVLNTGEDVNGNGQLDTYGGTNIAAAFGVAGGPVANRFTGSTIGKKNRVSGARHALKLIDGQLGNLPLKPDGTGGFTVASEQPVYIKGNYNANASGFGATNEAAAAVIADAVTLLSNNWTDANSLTNTIALSSRPATETWYRVAIAAGKNMTFPQPSFSGVSEDFGTDGGVHNFLRFLENWSVGGGIQAHYSGSLVSFFYSQYGNGIFKCCTVVYGAPDRSYAFDTNFLDPSKMPPGTPRFLDVVNVGYRQDFKAQ